jgi:hypothetical protein
MKAAMNNAVVFRIIAVTAIMTTIACGSGYHQQLTSLAATQAPVAQPTETLRVQRSLSKSKTSVYVRQVRFDDRDRLYHVQDFFESGQIQMDATYRYPTCEVHTPPGGGQV